MDSSFKMTSPSNIPGVKDLRAILHLNNPSSALTKEFNTRFNAFRRQYVTAKGLSGTELYHWNSPDHQRDLSVMINRFLATPNCANRFWADNTRDGTVETNSDRPIYTRDRSVIKKILMQLAFKLNL
ncbi:hypothetical protein BT63DRAFT_482051 [Microthyrium microscopicum]|uniref:Uncharacterized protein n=1 Tax=Microthyrium microscopicum TaxID=703497 RepID=A0A6A6U1V5_9PEZI|nr:hypothetical protein BT63DRAFT_482051 [Microthyrium microscopicum]